MKGYPKTVATKADFEMLLADPEYRDRVLAEMKKINAAGSEKVTQAVRPLDATKPDGEWETRLIDNPNPVWKQKGFKSAQEVAQLIAKADLEGKE